MPKHISYIKQRDKSSCGPIAIINILKWMGLPVTYNFIDIARHFCDWDPRYGVYKNGLINALNKFNIDFMIVDSPSIKSMDNHLDMEGIIIFDYYFSETAHYTLCVGHTKNFYKMVNDGLGNTIKLRSKKSIEKIIKSTKGTDESAIGYFIFK